MSIVSPNSESKNCNFTSRIPATRLLSSKQETKRLFPTESVHLKKKHLEMLRLEAALTNSSTKSPYNRAKYQHAPSTEWGQYLHLLADSQRWPEKALTEKRVQTYIKNNFEETDIMRRKILNNHFHQHSQRDERRYCNTYWTLLERASSIQKKRKIAHASYKTWWKKWETK